MPMIQIGLRNAQNTIKDLEARVSQILQDNEKLKIQATERMQLQLKYQSLMKDAEEMEQELESCSRIHKEQTTYIEEQQKQRDCELQQNKKLRIAISEVEQKLKSSNSSIE